MNMMFKFPAVNTAEKAVKEIGKLKNVNVSRLSKNDCCSDDMKKIFVCYEGESSRKHIENVVKRFSGKEVDKEHEERDFC